jgi:hypothetical protein
MPLSLSQPELWIAVVAALSFNGLAVLLVGAWVRGAARRFAAMVEELSLAGLALQRDINVQQLAVPDNEGVTRRLNQIVMDATGQFAGISQVVMVGTRPTYLAAEGQDYTSYVFSPYRIARNQRGQRLDRRIKQHVISPVTGHSFVVEQLEAIYEYLVSRRVADMHEAPPPLPRVGVWHLLIAPRGIELDF